MHNNFHFLSQFSKELNNLLVGKKLVESFSQLKDELVLGFTSEKESTYLKTTISQNFAITTVVNEFHQAKRNVKQLFHELIGLEVQEVYQFTYERAFVILFKNSKYPALIFSKYSSAIFCS